MERSFWSTIRGKLLSRTLLSVLIPALIIGGVAIASFRSLSGTTDASVADARATLGEDVVGTHIASVSRQIAREVAVFVDERIADAEGWSNDPGLISAVREANSRSAALGLLGQTVDEVEQRFAADPRLGAVDVEAELISAVSSASAFTQVLVTDVNGFTVDYSSQPPNFVQADEPWWTEAMETGLSVSSLQFDNATGAFSLDVAVRMDDADAAVGVLKAELDVSAIQVIADRFAGGSESFDISIVDQAGLFLAETATAHDGARIMNPGLSAATAGVSNEVVTQVFAVDPQMLHPDGYSIFQDRVGGYAYIDTALLGSLGDEARPALAIDWVVVVEQPTDVAFAALAPLEQLSNDVSSASSLLTILLIVATIVGTAIAGFVTLMVARKITAPIARLRNAAVNSAEVTLPSLVAQYETIQEGEDLPELTPLTLKTGDEVEDLAHSFNIVQNTAAGLAAEQIRSRRNNLATFVNLGRRNQNLLSRQMEYIYSMETNEADPESLQRLFQLDHLATRMRRNAESLLVLAGETAPRRFGKPVSVYQLVQAASGEIEHFDRVEVQGLEPAAVSGVSASDLSHLLAELLENATRFTPPGVPIEVKGRWVVGGYAIEIIDHGIGMDDHELAAANARIADVDEFHRSPSSAFLGHYVVGHLAERHGLQVELTRSTSGGVTANLHLPVTVIGEDTSSGSPTPSVSTAADSFKAAVSSVPAATLAAPSSTPDATETSLSESDLAQLEAIEWALHDTDPTAPTSSTAVDDVLTGDAMASDVLISTGVTADVLTTDVFAPDAVTAHASGVTEELPAGDTTPSGFRRRRRGEEGAPAPAAQPAAERQTAAASRTPEEVRDSLERFRLGVETGRAESNEFDNDPTSSELGGEPQ